MDEKSTLENKIVSVVSDPEKNQQLIHGKKTWVKPSIQSFSVLRKTEGGGDATPEFLAGFIS